MKKLLVGLLTLSSLSVFAKEEVVSKIQERGTKRELIISQDVDGNKNDLVYTLKNKSVTLELNRISYMNNDDAIEARGKYNTYKFNLFKAGIKASGSLYNWCWVDNALVDDTGFGPIVPTITTIAGGVVGLIVLGTTGATAVVVPVAIAGAGLAFCTVGAAVPAAALSVALLPVDAVISGITHFRGKATVNRKLEKALDGNDRKASKKVFELILKRVKDL